MNRKNGIWESRVKGKFENENKTILLIVRRFGYKFMAFTILSILFALIKEVQKQDKPEETGQDDEYRGAP